METDGEEEFSTIFILDERSENCDDLVPYRIKNGIHNPKTSSEPNWKAFHGRCESTSKVKEYAENDYSTPYNLKK